MEPRPARSDHADDERLVEFVSGLAHSLNNSFSVVVGSLGFAREALQRTAIDPETLCAIEDALEAGRRGSESLGVALACLGRQPLRPTSVPLNAKVTELAGLVRATLPVEIDLDVTLDDRVTQVQVDPGALENALLALTVNARQALASGGCISLTSRYRLASEPGAPEVRAPLVPPWVEIRVADDGEGMSPEVLEQACTAYFSTRSGRGLGLALTYGFARQSGGDLLLASRPGEGTEATLVLPAP